MRTTFFSLCLLCLCLKSSAQIAWANPIGESTAGSDVTYTVLVDASGNVYASGSFSGTVDFDPGAGTANLVSSGGTDAFVVKYNSSGTYVWAFKIGGGTDEYGYAYLSGTDLYVSGVINSTGAIDADPSTNTNNITGAGLDDCFVAKYDVNFNPSSTSFYKWAFTIGNTGGDGIYTPVQVSGNYLYVWGTMEGTLAIDVDPSTNTNTLTGAGSYECFLVKYDITLTPSSTSFYVWSFKIGTSDWDNAGAIVVSGTDIYITGSKGGTTATDMDPSTNTNNITGAGGFDQWVAKYDGSFAPSSTSFYKWAFTIGGTGDNNDSNIEVSGNDVYVTGTINSTTDMDPSANTNTIACAGSVDIFLAKYDGSLTPSNTSFYQWAFSMGSTGGDKGLGLDITGTDLFLCGRIDGTNNIDVDPSANTNNITGAGGREAYVVKYNISVAPSSTSFYQWGFKIGSTTNDQCYSICASSTDFHIGGSFTNSNVDFNPSPGTLLLTESGGSAGFVAKYGPVSPLPIELLSFTAEPINNEYVKLNWSTGTETNNDYFVIEKTTDTKNFETVAIVKGAGASTVKMDYTCNDPNPFNGISYYRLKQVDFNGTVEYFQLIAVEFFDKAQFVVFPNPSNGNILNVKYNGPDSQNFFLVFYDESGKKQYSEIVTLIDGQQKIVVQLAPAVYIYKAFLTPSITFSDKIIIE